MDTPIASRLHLVDAYPRGTSQPHNFLFRGNNPMSKNNSTFPLSSLEKMLRDSSLQECAVAVPESIRFVDLFLENPTDPGYANEVTFWRDRTDGDLIKYPTFGSLFVPWDTPLPFRTELIVNGTWAVQGHRDYLTERLAAVRSMLTNTSSPPTLFYAHCNAGCDRTGEFIAAYAMTFLKYNVTTAYGEACRQCGRCPNYYATNSIGWYCLTLQQLYNRTDLGDCLDFAGCKLFGDCDAHSPTKPANPCPAS